MHRSISILLTLLLATSLQLQGADADRAASAQFLAILRLTEKFVPEAAWTKEANEAVHRHFTRLQEGAKSGSVILAGRTLETNEKTMGLVIFKAANLEDAKAYMAADPAVVAGIMSVEVRPYQIAVSKSQSQ